uniref:ATP-binding protein n=1 Tax=Pseudomonas viridiflava TaxID=33069 RepID=UPI0023F92BFC
PLLDCSRGELEGYAREHGLGWIEDPSNDDVRFSRNFLRAQVMPLLNSRWPQAVSSMGHTARHLGEAQELLGELAEQDLTDAQATTSFLWLGLPVMAVG